MTDELVPDVVIQSVQFSPEGLVEITFMELRDQVEGAALGKHVLVESDIFAEDVAEIITNLRDLVDEALVFIRNPDARKQRLKALAEANEDDDDE